MKPAEWGVAVEKGDKVYLHITNSKALKTNIELKDFPYLLEGAKQFETGKNVEFSSDKKTKSVTLQIPELKPDAIDNVIVLKVKK
jgi:diaminopimelate epimerase